MAGHVGEVEADFLVVWAEFLQWVYPSPHPHSCNILQEIPGRRPNIVQKFRGVPHHPQHLPSAAQPGTKHQHHPRAPLLHPSHEAHWPAWHQTAWWRHEMALHAQSEATSVFRGVDLGGGGSGTPCPTPSGAVALPLLHYCSCSCRHSAETHNPHPPHAQLHPHTPAPPTPIMSSSHDLSIATQPLWPHSPAPTHG